MDTNTLFTTIQQGFHITIGATASLLETLQDTNKREQTLSEWQIELSQRVQEWAEKGKITEIEARHLVEDLLKSSTSSSPSQTTIDVDPIETSSPSAVDLRHEIQQLTQQLGQLRAELEQQKSSQSS